MGIFTKLFKGESDGGLEGGPENEVVGEGGVALATAALGSSPMAAPEPSIDPPADKPPGKPADKPVERAPLPGLTRPPPARSSTPPTGIPSVVTRTPTPPSGTRVPSPTTSAAKPAAKPEPSKAATTPRPSTAKRTPAQGVPVAPRAKKDSVGEAFDKAFAGTEVAKAPGVSTSADLEEVRKLFKEVAVNHVSQVRDVMLELRFGDADAAWMESTRPALRSLRAMATEMELPDLCAALDAFCSVVESSVQNRARITEEDKGQLLERYQRLIELIPQAFELDAERDRREPIIVEALLSQVEGVERLTVDKLFAVGLNRLEQLMNAGADEMVAVSGIDARIAEAIVTKFRSYRAAKPASVSVRDPGAERRELAELVNALTEQNADFMRVASTWTEDARARKRELRRLREQTFQQIKVVLARLGERERVGLLERLPFSDRIAALDRYLSAARQI